VKGRLWVATPVANKPNASTELLRLSLCIMAIAKKRQIACTDCRIRTVDVAPDLSGGECEIKAENDPHWRQYSRGNGFERACSLANRKRVHAGVKSTRQSGM
jgi:hypothetical protein